VCWGGGGRPHGVCVLASVQVGEGGVWGRLGARGRTYPLRTPTFLFIPFFEIPILIPQRWNVSLAHFAIFHKPSIDSEAVSTHSLCVVLRALSINLVFRFLARLYCSHDSSVPTRFAILPNRLALICVSLHSFVNSATDFGLGMLHGVDWSTAVLIDRTMACARSTISCGFPVAGATGISL
jgi:hypothetical protein